MKMRAVFEQHNNCNMRAFIDPLIPSNAGMHSSNIQPALYLFIHLFIYLFTFRNSRNMQLLLALLLPNSAANIWLAEVKQRR